MAGPGVTEESSEIEDVVAAPNRNDYCRMKHPALGLRGSLYIL